VKPGQSSPEPYVSRRDGPSSGQSPHPDQQSGIGHTIRDKPQRPVLHVEDASTSTASQPSVSSAIHQGAVDQLMSNEAWVDEVVQPSGF
jgi:hypothetical protein